MKEKKTNCGIYEIKNTGNNKCYIGSSSNLKSRKYMHLRLLERNKHPNIHLQKSYNKNDKENFIFSVIQYVDKINDKYLLKEELLKWEQYHIDNYKSNNGKLYNIRKKQRVT